MALSATQLASKINQRMAKAERRAKVPRGSIARAYIEESKEGFEGEKKITAWIEQQASEIKYEHARQGSVMSPEGLKGLFVGLK